MGYASKDDILKALDEAALIDLTSADGVTADEDIIAQAIADADAEIDAFLGTRYSVPLENPIGIITKISADIAVYNLYSRRVKPPDHRIRRYDNAIKILESIAKGKITLGAEDPSGTPAPASTPQFSSIPRIFSRTTLLGL